MSTVWRLVEITTKRCTKCGVEKPCEEFGLYREGRDGLRPDCRECAREAKRRWREANPQREAAYQRRWSKANPEKVAEYQRRWREVYPEKAAARDAAKSRLRRQQPGELERAAERQRRWYTAHPEKARAKKLAEATRLAEAVFAHYGTSCACCETTERLTIDHVNGDGKEHRQELGLKGGYPFYRWLKRAGFPPGYQTLCLPCNRSKGTGERCRIDHTNDSARHRAGRVTAADQSGRKAITHG